MFSRLPTPFPYVMIMPQARFLEFLVEEAKRYPHFKLVLGAHVDRLLEEDGAVRGVGYRSSDGGGEVRADVDGGLRRTLLARAQARRSRAREPIRRDGDALVSPPASRR